MRERARHFGGHMLMESSHTGTKISFKFASPKYAPSEAQDVVPQEDTAQPA
jgi:signal transduction histidine kinase